MGNKGLVDVQEGVRKAQRTRLTEKEWTVRHISIHSKSSDYRTSEESGVPPVESIHDCTYVLQNSATRRLQDPGTRG